MKRINLNSLSPYVRRARSGFESENAVMAGFEILNKNNYVAITIENSSATETVEVLLTPGSAGPNAPGLIRDGSTKWKGLVNGVEQATASVKSTIQGYSGLTIQKFLFNVNEFNLGCAGLRIRSNKDEQMQREIVFEHVVPFDREEEHRIPLYVYNDEFTVNNKVATIFLPFTLDKHVKTTITIPPGATTQILIFVGVYQSFDNSIKQIIAENPDMLKMAQNGLMIPADNQRKRLGGSSASVLYNNNMSQLSEKISKEAGDAVIYIDNSNPVMQD